MLDLFGRIFRNCFTGPDNKTYVLEKFLFAKGLISYLAYGWWLGYHGTPPDPMNFATGLSIILGGGGAAVGITRKANRPDMTAPAPRPPKGRFDDAA